MLLIRRVGPHNLDVFRAVHRKLHPMPVVADGHIGWKPMPWRAAPVQVESKCSCSHGPACLAGALQRRVGRRLVREAARRWTGRRPVATTPLTILVTFALSWQPKKEQYERASSSLGVSPRELHLALFPQGQPRRGLASQK
jgi:hypothetical protein